MRTPATAALHLSTILVALGAALPVLAVATAPAEPVADIGSRRELFVDDFLIERISGAAELRLQQPVPRELVLVHDEPWEGAGSGYHSVFQDGSLYRMYYKAWQRTPGPGAPDTDDNPLLCCYAESDDGIHWRKPELGIHAFADSTANNIVMASGTLGELRIDAGHPAVFKDENPEVAPDARYKAFLRTNRPRGLIVYASADGLHWSPLTDQPVLTDGRFDSQNLAFWDPNTGAYRAYWRYYSGNDGVDGGANPAGVRAIRTARSADMLHWHDAADISFTDSPDEQLYTNQIKPYVRAPHLYIGFPARYVDRGWSDEMRALPERAHREWRAARRHDRLGTALTDSLFMVSRDGLRFKRWNEAFLRPGPERPGTWTYGQQFIAWHPVVTRSALEGAADELSFYVSEQYWSGPAASAVRRYTLRLDGFVALRAPLAGGELLTRPLRFSGAGLYLNFATSAAGAVRVEIQDIDGTPLPGFALADCLPLFGDTVERRIAWTGGGDLAALAGRPVRLRIVLADADLYALQFRD
jgi:hypothetical protein